MDGGPSHVISGAKIREIIGSVGIDVDVISYTSSELQNAIQNEKSFATQIMNESRILYKLNTQLKCILYFSAKGESYLSNYLVITDASFKKKIGSTTAFIIQNPEGHIIASDTEFIKVTNYKDPQNIIKSELAAIRAALTKLLELRLQTQPIQLWSDSLASVNIINSNNASAYFEGFEELISKFTNIQFSKVHRDYVSPAHKLCYGVTSRKTLEKKLMRVSVQNEEGDIWLTQSPGNTKLYVVNLSKKSCTCIHYKKGKVCKHIKAVIFKSERVLNGEIKDNFQKVL